MLHMIAGVTAPPRWQWSSASGTFRESWRAIGLRIRGLGGFGPCLRCPSLRHPDELVDLRGDRGADLLRIGAVCINHPDPGRCRSADGKVLAIPGPCGHDRIGYGPDQPAIAADDRAVHHEA